MYSQASLSLWRGGGWEPLLAAGVTECRFVCPTHSEAKQTETLEFGAENSLLQGWAMRLGGLCSKKLCTPRKGFSKEFLKARWGKGAPGYVIRSCTILIGWWSLLRRQKVWGLRAHDHQVVNFFHLVVVLASEKLRKYAWDAIIWVLQRGTTPEDIGEGSILGRPHRLLLGYTDEAPSWGKHSDASRSQSRLCETVCYSVFVFSGD